PTKHALQEARLEPTVEVLCAAVVLGLAGRDEMGNNTKVPTQPDDARQVACTRAPAGDLAGVVELDLARPAERLPALVAGAWAAVGLEMPSNGEYGLFQFRWNAAGNLLVGPGQVVESVGAEFQVRHHLCSPGFTATEDLADVRGRAAAEAR